MPCNLAVTITKGQVLNEQLLALLTPEVVKILVEQFLQNNERYNFSAPRIHVSGGNVICYYGPHQIQITNGTTVTVTSPGYARTEGEQLQTDLLSLLTRAADKLFARQVQKSLAKFGKVEQQSATVNNDGQEQKVTMFRLEI